ncbi:hypothetical protein CEQ90_07935 [Lewinellaceae bacterium SD302]|nr:hypothetical protein CEQ90_07935 [Lewinellaceae bacterium SD302]
MWFISTLGFVELSAQPDRSIFDLLSTDPSAGIEMAKPVILRLPVDSIYAKTQNKQQAVISFTDDNTGREYRRPLHVEVRGKFRRHLCTFPPLKLNFSKKQLKADGLSKHDKLKLVTPCFDDDVDAQALILKEYLAYKLYEQLSPLAFRTQLLEITYRDIHGQHPDRTVLAFVLEDTDEMAERLGGVELENGRGLAPDRFDRRAETTQALFSYLIGNLDWNLSMAHNLKMVELTDGTIVPVPYDFDFSGLVAAPYVRLNSNIGQEYAGQRIYLGFDCSDYLLQEVYAHFELKRKDLLKTVRGFTILPGHHRFPAAEYITGFYSEFRRILRLQHHQGMAETLYQLIRAEQRGIVPAGGKAMYYGVSK